MNLSMNDECAFLLEGFDSPPVVMMTYNPRYYFALMEACGMSKAKDLYAFKMSRDHDVAEKVNAIVERARRETPVTLRIIDMKNLEEEARKVALIYNGGWEKNWGFVPWTDNEMKHMARSLKQLADPELIIFAEDLGRPVGFAFGLPNYNEILMTMNGRLFPFGVFKLLLNRSKIKGMRAVVFGLLKEYRHTGLSYLLYSEFEKRAKRKGYEWGELSWQLEDNDAINRFAASIGAAVYKKYRIFERPVGRVDIQGETG
jgi:GNAT superfamily N-acetyltransferase